jgi:DNA-binding beta-propeller fold protein YncE
MSTPYRIVIAWLGSVASVSGCAGGAPRVDPTATPASITWPAPPEQPRIRFVRTLATPADVGARRSRVRRLLDAITGHREPRILQPYGVAVDGAGRIYVTDTKGAGVHVFDPARRSYEFVRGVRSLPFHTPTGVAVDDAGNLYVADAQRGVVISLDPARRERWRTRTSLRRPTGLAIDTTDRVLYVVETQGHVVRMLSLDGEERGMFGGRGDSLGELNYPTNVTVGPDGEVYVTDAMNFRVQMFTRQGEPIAAFGRHGDALGDLARPKGIGLDREGHIYVVDGLYDVVNVYSRTGTTLLSFGGAGRRVGEFWLATGLTIDRRNRIYVADSYNSRVQVFEYLAGIPDS